MRIQVSPRRVLMNMQEYMELDKPAIDCVKADEAAASSVD
jgi:hypothetical protein